ncbi:glycosyltransferase family 4 protein [Tepidiforma sp.]|uniref:glycosyltransferase family 4 protein n=1 Tax=Tepidiforma sp. TaxID=2682230 RepID=UPI002ADDE016|nr:glycosyltransferase family 4 protein [Tepidiforma sp.]
MKIAVLSRAAVGPQMASPGVRAYQLAGALARALPEAEVTLLVPGDRGEVAPPAKTVRLQRYDSNADALFFARQHEVVISRNFPPQFLRLMGRTRLALDGFTPLFIEWMELSRRDILPKWRRTWMASNRWYLNFQLTLADFIFCADDRQRDLWIGMLMALDLVPPSVYARDPSLRRYIDVVPYGVPAAPLRPKGPALRGVVPGIEPGDEVILWNGGITEWNDTETLLRAMAELAGRRPRLRLVFMGINHPDFAFGPNAGVTRQTIDLARELGLEGRSVFFRAGWVPYHEIDSYLAEADLSVCLGYENLESRFAFRTRYVDLFRARVPLVCTRGDVLAERVERDPLGITVPERDPAAVAAAIERLLDDADFRERCRANLARVAQELSWDAVVEPLAAFCASGDSVALPARQRLPRAAARAGMYFALKKACKSPPLHGL